MKKPVTKKAGRPAPDEEYKREDGLLAGADITEIKDKKLRVQIRELLEKRMELKGTEARVKGEVAEIDAKLIIAYSKASAKSLVFGGQLHVCIESDGQNRFDKKKATTFLLKKGVKSTIVDAMIAHATTKTKGSTHFQSRALNAKDEGGEE